MTWLALRPFSASVLFGTDSFLIRAYRASSESLVHRRVATKKNTSGGGIHNARSRWYSLVTAFDYLSRFLPQCTRPNRHRHFRELWPPCASRLRAADLPHRRLPMDARLLGFLRGWLFLGARHVGSATPGGFPLDPGLLGLGRQRIR